VAGVGDGTGDLALPDTVRTPPLRPPQVQRAPLAPPPRPRPALPPVPSVGNTRRRSAFLLTGAAALAAAVAIVLVVVLTGGNEPRSGATPAPTTSVTQGRLIAQYEYQFTLPSDWLQTGGDATLLRTEVKPADAPSGDDLVLVQQIRLSFDSDDDRSRAVDKLRDEFASAGDTFTGFDDDATYAGREVIRYQQALPNKDATVNWYVVFQATTQVSVGCQHENSGGRDAEVAAACEMIVRTLRITA
jgi:type VII secretion-associated protein (TIGR03931 family)